jgi:hypothetical protein
MNYTNTQLKYVNRDNKPDTAFVIALKRQSATRTIKAALKASLWATVQLTELATARLADGLDNSHANMDKYRASWGIATSCDSYSHEIERERNLQGQFI